MIKIIGKLDINNLENNKNALISGEKRLKASIR